MKIFDTRKFFVSKAVFLSVFLLGIFLSKGGLAADMFKKRQFLEDDKIPWEISANKLIYKEKEGVYSAHGDVVISRADQSLYAQEAIYNVVTGIATVSGDVRLEYGGDILEGEEGFFDLNNQTGKIINGSFFLHENHYYLKGDLIQKLSKDTYLIKNCRLTTCDGENPDWSISGSEVRVTIEGYGQVKHAAFRTRGLPIAYVPYMIFPAKTKRQSGLLPPRVGYSKRTGVDIEAPFFWAISDQTDATFYQRFMSKRGYMQGAEFRYVAEKDSKGTYQFDIMHDRKKKDMSSKEDLALSPYEQTNQTRYWLRGRMNQDLRYGLEARMDADFVSDQDYLRTFETGLLGFEGREDLVEEYKRPFWENRSATRRSALRISRDGEEYSLQGLGSYYQNPVDPKDDKTPQPLGGLNFTLLPEQIRKLPIFFGLKTDYDYVWREKGQRGQRFSLSPEVNFPLWLGRYIEFEPSFRYTFNAQWFQEPQDGQTHQYKGAYEARVRLETNAERIFDFQWRDVKKLRHKISPILLYTYGARHDTYDYLPWFEPLDEKISTKKDEHLVSLSIENFLDAKEETKKGKVTYHQWAALKIGQGYDLSETDEPLTPLEATLTAYPFNNLDVRGTVKWDHYDSKISFASLSFESHIERSGGRRDLYKVNYLYNQGAQTAQEQFNLWLNVNLAYGFSVGGSLQRDLAQERSISSSGWFGYETQCWGVKLGAQKQYENTSVMMVFRLTGIADTGTWW